MQLRDETQNTHESASINNLTFKKLRLDIIKINGYGNKEKTKKKDTKYRAKEVFSRHG
jgi:hypothetical protein